MTMLTPHEVASLFGVTPKTVARWATAGKISVIKTPGGHRRYREEDVATLLAISSKESSSDNWEEVGRDGDA